MAEPREGLLLRGTRTGEYVSAWVQPSAMQVHHFALKELVCFMGEEGAAEYCEVAPCGISYRWYRWKGNPIGSYLEVVTWEVHFIPCAKWNSDSQRLHVLLEPLHDGDAGAASSSSAPSDTLPFQ